MDYKYFYLAVRRYAKRKINRKEFITEWRYRQLQQGMAPGQGGTRTVAK